MPRHGNNIYKRKDGRWEGRVKRTDVGRDTPQYTSLYGKTYKEVKDKMELFKLNQRTETVGACCNLAEAVNLWLSDHQSTWKPSTYAAYRQIAEKHIIPIIGSCPVKEITEHKLEEFASCIRHLSGETVLSNRHLHQICSVVIMAVKHAKRKFQYRMEIPENPISQKNSSRRMLPPLKDMAVLEKYLLAHAQDDTCLGILIAFYTGLRIGELCALVWGDIDTDEEVIYIRRNLQRVKQGNGDVESTSVIIQSPKTIHSDRVIPIPPILLPLLKIEEHGSSEPIIKGKKNIWAEPRTLQYRFRRILKECGIENFNFHMLRHAFATKCIDQGFDVKAVSEILGHSSVQITLNLYVHSTIEHKKQLMKKFDVQMYNH